jgi:hypothetical protein
MIVGRVVVLPLLENLTMMLVMTLYVVEASKVAELKK